MKNHNALSALIVLILGVGILANTGCKKDEEEDPETKQYTLKIKDQPGITGTVTFTETSSTVTTVTIKLNGGSANSHPAHIHSGAAIENGPVAISLNPVDSSGNSITEVTKLDNGTPISYDQLLVYDGYVNVHESIADVHIIIAQTDIGNNELTGTQKPYTLTEVTPGVSGSALFEQRKGGHTLITLSLNGTVTGGLHPAHIHIGSITTPGEIKKTLSSIPGASGTTAKSYTNVRALDDGTPITYDGLLNYTGYINVHKSDAEPNIILAHGNIGSNP
jgi:Cu/Zn superoxide dismutase